MTPQLAFRGALRATAEDGSSYLIDVFQVVDDGSHDRISGPVIYRTPDGVPVKRIRSGVYEMESSRIPVRLVDWAVRIVDWEGHDKPVYGNCIRRSVFRMTIAVTRNSR